MEMRAAVYDGLWEAAYSLLFGIIIGSSFFGHPARCQIRFAGGWRPLRIGCNPIGLAPVGQLGGPVLPESLGYWVYPATQPLARILIGLWLLRVARQGDLG